MSLVRAQLGEPNKSSFIGGFLLCFEKKKVLTIVIRENENDKYLMSVLNNVKNRGIKDILIMVLLGIKEAITVVFLLIDNRGGCGNVIIEFIEKKKKADLSEGYKNLAKANLLKSCSRRSLNFVF